MRENVCTYLENVTLYFPTATILEKLNIVTCCPDIFTLLLLSTLGVVKVGNKKADPPVDIALVGLK